MTPLAIDRLPRNWVSAKIAELFGVVGGGTPDTQKPEYWEGTFPWISSADIDERHRITPRRAISRKGIDNSATNLVPKGSVIIVTRVGLGKTALADRDLCFSQDSQALLFDSAVFDPHFVLYQMSQSVRVFRYVSRGTTISGVTKKQLLDLDFKLPPLTEQRKIVAEVEKQFTRLDAAVAALKRVQANLKRYRASVLKAACEGRLVPTEAELARREGRSYEPASELLKRILADRRSRWEATQIGKLRKSTYQEPPSPTTDGLPSLPEGWTWAATEQAGELRLGRQRAPENHNGPYMRPYLRVANVFEDRIDTSDVLSMNFTPAEFETYKLKSDDVLLNEGQSLELVGRSAIYRDEVPGSCFQNTLIRFRSASGIEPKYALTVFLAYLHNKRFQEAARWTVNIAHLGADRLSKIEFPIPPTREQTRIVAEVERRTTIIDELEMEVESDLKRAERLRQAILKRAFEGKLVPQDPNDEPASVLLERIRAERARRDETQRANRRSKPKLGRKKKVASI